MAVDNPRGTWAVSDQVHEPVLEMDADKPHRCPACWAVTIDNGPPRQDLVYQCCRCGRRFCAFPEDADELAFAGVVCSEHWDRPAESPEGRFVYRTSPLPSVTGVVTEVRASGLALLSLSDGTKTACLVSDIEVPR